jgi:hypothetical protein
MCQIALEDANAVDEQQNADASAAINTAMLRHPNNFIPTLSPRTWLMLLPLVIGRNRDLHEA